jgi:hypothetical protein
MTTLLVLAGVLAAPLAASAQATDPRVGLGGGHFVDAAEAISNLTLVSHTPKPAGWFNPANLGDFATANSDLAFSGHYVLQGSYNGIQIWDATNPAHPTLVTGLVCPGGQGDPSVYGHLMFMSVEETRGRVDCGTQGVRDSVSPDRFRGVRIFDITDIAHPKQVAAVQTCRGSHTHTLVPDPKDPGILYVYVQGTGFVRPGAELAGCSGGPAETNPNTALFRIEIIRVPLASPQDAKIISSPRIFANAQTGQINGLAKEIKDPTGNHGTAETNMCHDITVYPAIGLAAGACSGNGILLDIRDPANPKRIAEISDPNFAYWHSATFNNDGSKVVYTDEWGGGTGAKCRASDPPTWGADAIVRIVDGKLVQSGFYKLPAAQSEVENCVAHNGSLIPIPGRDIMVQGWYQGGVSVFDFSDPAHVHEIAYFDRGPLYADRLALGGYWSAYWYNGYIYGSEIARGLDIFELKPSEYLSQNEIDAAKLVQISTSNPSDQPKIVWPASFVVTRAYLDQLARGKGLSSDEMSKITTDLAAAEQMSGKQQKDALNKLAKQVEGAAKGAGDPDRVKWLASSIKELAGK